MEQKAFTSLFKIGTPAENKHAKSLAIIQKLCNYVCTYKTDVRV
jgi:hypothetical protein